MLKRSFIKKLDPGALSQGIKRPGREVVYSTSI